MAVIQSSQSSRCPVARAPLRNRQTEVSIVKHIAHKTTVRSSLRKRLLVWTLSIMISLVLFLTTFSVLTTYNAMYDQLMLNKQIENDWLAERYAWFISEYADQLNKFEVGKTLKSDLQTWCEGELGYLERNRIISECNAIIAQNADIVEMRLFNLIDDEVLVVERSGSHTEPTNGGLLFWQNRSESLQSNTVLQEHGGRLQISHLFTRFENNEPLVLITLYVRMSALSSIAQEFTAQSGALFLFNDDSQLLYASVPDGSGLTADTVGQYLRDGADRREGAYKGYFWFVQGVSRDKITIVQAVPHNMITGTALKNIYAGLAAAGIAVLAAVSFSLLFSKIFSRPIIALSKKMQTATIKDYQEQSGAERNDEVGLLESSFDTMIKRNRELIGREYQTRIEKRSAQLRALQAQINPHFLYNTLQVIGGMALRHGAPDINEIASNLSDILRYSLSFGKEMVQVRQELKFLQSYLDIQNRRFGDRISISLETDESLMDCMIPKLIMQPLVENSLQHGLSGKGGKWRIRIAMKKNGEDLSVTVEDNGRGIPPGQLETIVRQLDSGVENTLSASSHIGLGNVNSRIRLKFGAGYGVALTSEEGKGTRVELRMPMQRGEEDAV
ncbi:MAG: sensor histidine kinase [Clostridiales bacterium]|nr:sensor histidine kinase [Clostridiales bacterium]